MIKDISVKIKSILENSATTITRVSDTNYMLELDGNRIGVQIVVVAYNFDVELEISLNGCGWFTGVTAHSLAERKDIALLFSTISNAFYTFRNLEANDIKEKNLSFWREL